MIKLNVGRTDQAVRVGTAILLFGTATLGAFSPAVAALLYLVAAVLVGTAGMGFCPLYNLLGISTHRRERSASSSAAGGRGLRWSTRRIS